MAAGRRHAYVKCSRSNKLRSVLGAIVSQLGGAKRKRGQAYASTHGGTEASLCWELQGAAQQQTRAPGWASC